MSSATESTALSLSASQIEDLRLASSNLVGRAAESTVAAASIILSGVLERFPDLKIVLVHGGGFLPFQIGRLDRGYEAKPGLVGRGISRAPSEYLKMMWVDTVVHDPRVLRFVIEMMGADRVLLGTDYPFEMGDTDPVTLIESAVADPATSAAIGGGNIAKLIGR